LFFVRAAFLLHFCLGILDIGGNNTNIGGFILRANLLEYQGNGYFTGVCADLVGKNGIQEAVGSIPISSTVKSMT